MENRIKNIENTGMGIVIVRFEDGSYTYISKNRLKEIIHLLGLDKVYYVQHNVGKSKYCLNYHDGEKKHTDGSDFYDIFLTNNKRTLAKFVSGLKKQGYTERMFPL